MNTLTIPKKLTRRGELIVIPRTEYETLLNARKWKEELDTDLQKSLKDYREGKYYGPFSSVEEMKKSFRKKR